MRLKVTQTEKRDGKTKKLSNFDNCRNRIQKKSKVCFMIVCHHR